MKGSVEFLVLSFKMRNAKSNVWTVSFECLSFAVVRTEF